MTYTKRIILRHHYVIRTYRNDGTRAKVKDVKWSPPKKVDKPTGGISNKPIEIPRHNKKREYIQEILTNTKNKTKIFLNYHTLKQREKILRQLRNIDLNKYGPDEKSERNRAKKVKRMVNDIYESDGVEVKSYKQSTLREMDDKARMMPANKKVLSKKDKKVDMKKLVGGFRHVF